MSYEMNKTDAENFAYFMSAQTHTKGDEQFWQACPYCEGGKGKDENTFSVNLKSGAFKCFRASCGKQGHFVQLAKDFGYRLDFGFEKVKEYKPLPQNPIEVRMPAIEYLASRSISRSIAEKYKITTHLHNDKILAFPFYDDKGVLRFVKYRKTDFQKGIDKNKEWCEADTMPILFGMWQCKNFERLIITEGQIDSLSVSECGIDNAVSVPTGAKGFTWLSHCWEWLQRFKVVVVFGDYENGKVTLVDELSKRLPKLKVVQPQYYLGEKDANAILQKFGKQAVIDAVENAEIEPIQHVKRLADVEMVKLSSLPKIETNIPEVDRIIGGMYFGQVILLTGKRGEGKSTFMSQLIGEALEQKYSVFAYSGELPDYNFRSWIDFQLAGTANLNTEKNKYGDNVYSIGEEVGKKIGRWYYDKAFIYDNNAVDDENELESLLDTVEKTVQRYGINFVCIDNLMTALDVDIKDDMYRSQSKFVHRLKKIATKYNIVVLLVAHPKKKMGDFDNDDVSGSSDITNRVDIVMNYSRSKPGSEHDGELLITKNRLTGTLVKQSDPIQLSYSQKSKRIASVLYGDPNRKYGWESDTPVWGNLSLIEDLPL